MIKNTNNYIGQQINQEGGTINNEKIRSEGNTVSLNIDDLKTLDELSLLLNFHTGSLLVHFDDRVKKPALDEFIRSLVDWFENLTTEEQLLWYSLYDSKDKHINKYIEVLLSRGDIRPLIKEIINNIAKVAYCHFK